MNIRKFCTGRTIGLIIVLVGMGIVAGFYAFNNYIYKEKQGDSEISEHYIDSAQVEGKAQTPTFVWQYENADSLNLDGLPQTNIFLEVKYPTGVTLRKLIDTTPGTCNSLPDSDIDSVLGSSNIQCYSAGLGYRFKITTGKKSYLVERKTFEEASPDYNPPPYKYEIISEFPLL